MNIFRDPLWQFVGVIIALFAVGVSFFIYYLQKQKKSLSYEIMTNTPILTVNEQIEGKLEVLYEKILVNKVQLVTLKLINNGNIPITSNDYERKLSLNFDDESKVLSSKIIDVRPDNLITSLIVEQKKVSIEPVLMNRKDYIIIKTLVSNSNGEIKLEGRIVGVDNIEQLKLPFYKKNLAFITGVVSGVVVEIGAVIIFSTSIDRILVAPLITTMVLIAFFVSRWIYQGAKT